jgi:hypothetical protein
LLLGNVVLGAPNRRFSDEDAEYLPQFRFAESTTDLKTTTATLDPASVTVTLNWVDGPETDSSLESDVSEDFTLPQSLSLTSTSTVTVDALPLATKITPSPLLHKRDSGFNPQWILCILNPCHKGCPEYGSLECIGIDTTLSLRSIIITVIVVIVVIVIIVIRFRRRRNEREASVVKKE